MKLITKWLLKYKVFILGVLGPLGIWGAFLVAFVDSGTIPVPMDLIMAGYIWADKRHFYLYVLLAALGSAIGGLIPFLLGRAGGEIFLLRRITGDGGPTVLTDIERPPILQEPSTQPANRQPR